MRKFKVKATFLAAGSVELTFFIKALDLKDALVQAKNEVFVAAGEEIGRFGTGLDIEEVEEAR